MVYRGKFQDGVVVLDDATGLSNGVCVTVEPIKTEASPTLDNPPSWAETFKDFIGVAKDLPEDFARNHDHYIHGAPKK